MPLGSKVTSELYERYVVFQLPTIWSSFILAPVHPSTIITVVINTIYNNIFVIFLKLNTKLTFYIFIPNNPNIVIVLMNYEKKQYK